MVKYWGRYRVFVSIKEDGGPGNGNNNKEKKNLNNPNQFKSIADWWQQYSPLAFGEMYNEYIEYTTKMTEIYKEYIKSSERMTELYKDLAVNTERMTELYRESVTSTERMTKYWLTRFPNPLPSKEQRRERQPGKLKEKK
jgi:hypothetical protein